MTSVKGATPAVIAAASLGQRWAYADSMHNVWYASIAFGILAIVCCIFMPNMERFMTDRVAVDIH